MVYGYTGDGLREPRDSLWESGDSLFTTGDDMGTSGDGQMTPAGDIRKGMIGRKI